MENLCVCQGFSRGFQNLYLASCLKKSGTYLMYNPNVLLIVSEDNGPHLGCYGDLFVDTPHLDQLAAEGIRFSNAYTTQAVCSPARASILTGLYPHQNGQIGLATHKYAMFPAHAVEENLPNIPSLLKANGYRTGLIGKLHINPESEFPFDLWWNDPSSISFANRDMQKTAQVAEKFVTESNTPFFLMVNYPDAHLPFHRQQFGLPKVPYEAEDVETLPFVGVDTPRLRAQTADYYNCISRLDTGVGLLLDRLQQSGKANNTVVIFTTDHGAQFSRGKTAIYESGLKIPFILRLPSINSESLVKDELISHVDVLSTIMEVTGTDCPDSVAGKSLVPLIQEFPVCWREYLFAEWCSAHPPIYFPQRSVRDQKFKLILNLLQDRPSPSAIGYSGESSFGSWEPGASVAEIASADKQIRKVYQTYKNPPAEELYDLENDPWEFNNLAGLPKYEAEQHRLRDQLRSWQESTKDALLNPAHLNRLTEEHNTIVAEYYQESAWGKSRAYEWCYAKYLSQH